MDYERSLFRRTSMRMVMTPSGVLPEALDEADAAAYCVNI